MQGTAGKGQPSRREQGREGGGQHSGRSSHAPSTVSAVGWLTRTTGSVLGE